VARSGETLGACWSEIDTKAKVWTVPAVRMKADRPHRVPLTPRAIEILDVMEKAKVSDFVFPGTKPAGHSPTWRWTCCCAG
jgi:integrase